MVNLKLKLTRKFFKKYNSTYCLEGNWSKLIEHCNFLLTIWLHEILIMCFDFFKFVVKNDKKE